MDGRTTTEELKHSSPACNESRTEVITMKVLRTIDNQILAFWYTAPSDRLWAYLATFVPATAFIIGLMTQVF